MEVLLLIISILSIFAYKMPIFAFVIALINIVVAAMLLTKQKGNLAVLVFTIIFSVVAIVMNIKPSLNLFMSETTADTLSGEDGKISSMNTSAITQIAKNIKYKYDNKTKLTQSDVKKAIDAYSDYTYINIYLNGKEYETSQKISSLYTYTSKVEQEKDKINIYFTKEK